MNVGRVVSQLRINNWIMKRSCNVIGSGATNGNLSLLSD